MAIELKLRRGTTEQNNAFIGAEGELTVDTEKKQLRLHDGNTAGGVIIGNSDTRYIAHQSMPSDKYIELEIGATGTDYIMPDDGYLTFIGAASSITAMANLIGQTSNMGINLAPLSSSFMIGSIPVKVNDIIKLRYVDDFTEKYLVFSYTEGNK